VLAIASAYRTLAAISTGTRLLVYLACCCACLRAAGGGGAPGRAQREACAGVSFPALTSLAIVALPVRARAGRDHRRTVWRRHRNRALLRHETRRAGRRRKDVMSKSGKRALFVVGTSWPVSWPSLHGADVVAAGGGERPRAHARRRHSRPRGGGGLLSSFGGRKPTMRDYLERCAGAGRPADQGPGRHRRTRRRLGQAPGLRDAYSTSRRGGSGRSPTSRRRANFSPGNRDYYLATSCGTIWLAPSGDITSSACAPSRRFSAAPWTSSGSSPTWTTSASTSRR